ncbi:hypothetical protein Mapa_015701 [Marchantia paleacea]|nr:hypothetical protein Mapa_015701 [Marchantia paleacea]
MIARIVGSFRRSAGPQALSGAIKGRLATGTGSLRGCARSAERIARRRSGGVLGLVSGREGGLRVPAVWPSCGDPCSLFSSGCGAERAFGGLRGVANLGALFSSSVPCPSFRPGGSRVKRPFAKC